MAPIWLNEVNYHPEIYKEELKGLEIRTAASDSIFFISRGPNLLCFEIDEVSDSLKPTLSSELKKELNSTLIPNKVSERKSFKLEHPLLDFNIKGLSVNRRGTLLVVYGNMAQKKDDNRLVVIPLLEVNQFFKGLSMQTNVKAYEVAHEILRAYPIKKIDWHPLSTYSTSLVILSSASILCMFELSKSISQPELILDLTQDDLIYNEDLFKERKLLPSIFSDDETVVDFTFGSTSAISWEPFTIYVTTSTFRNFYVCPVSPLIGTISRELIQILSYNILSDLSSLLESEDKSLDFEEHLALSSEFLSDRYNYSNTHSGFENIDFNLHKKSHDLTRFHPRRSNFMFYEPYLLDQNDKLEVSNLSLVSTSDVSLLLTCLKDGKIYVGAITDFPEPNFSSIKKNLNDNPSPITTLEVLDLKLTKLDKEPVLYKLILDPLLSLNVYVLHSEGAHLINLTNLVQKLELILNNNNSALTYPPTVIKKVLTTNNQWDMVFLANHHISYFDLLFVNPILLKTSLEYQFYSARLFYTNTSLAVPPRPATLFLEKESKLVNSFLSNNLNQLESKVNEHEVKIESMNESMNKPIIHWQSTSNKVYNSSEGKSLLSSTSKSPYAKKDNLNKLYGGSKPNASINLSKSLETSNQTTEVATPLKRMNDIIGSMEEEYQQLNISNNYLQSRIQSQFDLIKKIENHFKLESKDSQLLDKANVFQNRVKDNMEFLENAKRYLDDTFNSSD